MLHGLEGRDVRALHRTRVASRRLRELLPILQLKGKVAGDLARRLQKVTRRLGKVRELDVLIQLIESLQSMGRYNRDALALVAAAIGKERVEARKWLQHKLPLRELRRVRAKLDKLAAEVEDVDAESGRGRALRWAVEARVQRRGTVLKAAIEDAGSVYLPDRLHAVRIALKKFRYAVELAHEISVDERMTGALRLLRRHQDVLGQWHDRQVLIDRVRQVQASLTPPDIRAWRALDTLVTTLENECRGLHARYVRGCGALVAVCDRIAVRPATAARRAG